MCRGNDLTIRELEVLRSAARTDGIEESARELFISPKTVEHHRVTLMQKLGCHTMARAVAIGFHRGLVQNGPCVPFSALEEEMRKLLQRLKETPSVEDKQEEEMALFLGIVEK